MIAPRIPIRDKQCRVQFQNPGSPIPDGRGGYTVEWFSLDPPELDAAIRPATASDLERAAAGTIISSAPLVLVFPYHPQVTTKTRILYPDPDRGVRTFTVAGVGSPFERRQETEALCNEVLA